jgi:hypothetical protein
MNNKTKGDYSEARVLYEFQKFGVPIAIPWGDNQRYDLIAEFNGKLNKIQIKTANEERNGAIICYCRSSTNHTTNKNKDLYIDEIDYFVFYNQIKDLLAIVPIEEVGNNKTLNLRIDKPKSNQIKGIKFFKDFSFEKFFNK